MVQIFGVRNVLRTIGVTLLHYSARVNIECTVTVDLHYHVFNSLIADSLILFRHGLLSVKFVQVTSSDQVLKFLVSFQILAWLRHILVLDESVLDLRLAHSLKCSRYLDVIDLTAVALLLCGLCIGWRLRSVRLIRRVVGLVEALGDFERARAV